MGKIQNLNISLLGKSGKKYTFDIYTLDTKFNSVGGVYVFIHLHDSLYDLIYCGQTQDLSTRFDNHHKQDCIDSHNATHICVMRVDSEVKRTEIETDILANNYFPCNDVNN